ncbi:MAG TPA: DUF3108 domain-containing protein [Terriglobia bacterium]|nr:DUF3108 domain-containing protein [Terriglobia bacterium]
MPFRLLRALAAAGSVLAPLALLHPGALRAQQGDPPFAPGEDLTYQITWSAFSAGEITATLQKAALPDGDEYEVSTTAQSHGFVSLLYNLNDKFVTLFDPQTACAREITKTVNEGRRHKRTRIIFDAARKLAILDESDLSKPGTPPKHAENDIPACVQDPVTAFYFLRRRPLRVGDKVHVPINDGAKTIDVTAEVQAREEITTPLGKRFAFRVEPKVFGNLYKRKGRMLVWFSDDAQRLPLRIRAMISVGTITGTLTSVTASPASGRATGPRSAQPPRREGTRGTYEPQATSLSSQR